MIFRPIHRFSALLIALVLMLSLLGISAVDSVCDASTNGVPMMTAKACNVRTGPGMNYSIQFRLKRNTLLTVTDTSGQWCHISINNTTGYVHYTNLCEPSSAVLGASRSKSQTADPTKLAAQALSTINTTRKQQGLSPYTLNTTLTQSANQRAKEISTRFSHNRPNGSSFETLPDSLGIPYNAIGENIGYGNMDGAQIINLWMTSGEHREMIISSYFTQVAIGVYVSPEGIIYYVSEFIG